jgi:formylglycine-generating enzyme required for sulfatase activity
MGLIESASGKVYDLMVDLKRHGWLEVPPKPPSLNGRWTNSLGQVFAPVPGTKVLFCIWDVRVRDYAAYSAGSPGVDASWRNPGFPQGDDHPVVNVSWDDAQAFCRWLTLKERNAGNINAEQSYRLPTDAEWSVAAGLEEPSGGTPKGKDGKIRGVYPWGTEWPPPRGAGNYHPSLNVDDYEFTSPAESFKPDRHGLYDMGGNVWQWSEDWYDTDQKSRVLRGASWSYYVPDLLLSSGRDRNPPGFRNDTIGFRVVLEDDSPR